MWRFGQRMGWVLGAAALVLGSAPRVGGVEQLLKQLPAFITAREGERPLASVSWNVISDSGQPIERLAPTGSGQPVLVAQQATPSTAWLGLHGGRSRAANREPDFWRHEF